MKLKEYVLSRVGTAVDYDGYYWSQCVDQARDYSVSVLWENFKPTGNAASLFYQDWGNTFTKYDNTPDFLPIPWDICIWKWPTVYGHIGVVLKASLTEMTIIDQNTGDGSWDGKWDNLIRIHTYSYNDVLGFLRHESLIENILDEVIEEVSPESNMKYKGLEVIHANHMIKSEYGAASYATWFDKIFVNDRFFTFKENEQEYFLEHEYWHHVYRDIISENYRKLWELISNPSQSLLSKVNARMGTNYTNNSYVTEYAETNESEDFSECCRAILAKKGEWVSKDFWDYRDFKLLVVKAYYKKYNVL